MDANHISAIINGLEASEWRTPEEVVEAQLKDVRGLLKYSVRRVPYYRKLFHRCGLRPDAIRSLSDLRSIPQLTRRTFQESIAQFRTKLLPDGEEFVGETNTSGTMGVPIKMLWTNNSRDWWAALLIRDLRWCGRDPKGTLVSIRPTKREFVKVRRARWDPAVESVVGPGGPTHVIDSRTDPREQIELLQEIQPDYIVGVPSNLEYLASLSRERELEWSRLKFVHTISETLSPVVETSIRESFKVPVKNTYSCEEMGYLASPCPLGHGLHVHSENVLIEVVDDAGQPCREGDWGWAVLTSLRGYATPLIRYAIRDRIRFAGHLCPCGRGLPLLRDVQGKARPLFVLAGGRRVDSQLIAQLIAKIGGMHQYQVIQHDLSRVTVKVVPSNVYSASHSERIRAGVIENLGQQVEVTVVKVDSIPLGPGGKFQGFIVENMDS